MPVDPSILYSLRSIRVNQAAQLLECSPRSILNMIADGRLQRYGAGRRICVEGVRRYLNMPDTMQAVPLSEAK